MNNILQSMQNIIQRPGFFTSMDFTKGRVLRFYSLLILLFTLASVAILLPDAVRFAKTITSQTWQNQTEIITELYPDELEVRVVSGNIYTNVEEPLSIPFPVSWRTGEGASMPENLLVIDTAKSITLEDFAAKKTAFILSKNTLGAWDQKEGRVSIYDLGNMKSEAVAFLLTKAKYTQFISQASSVIQKALLVGMCFLPIFFYIAYWIGYLIYLLFGAVIVWFVGKMRGYQLSYKHAYKAGIYLLPIPLVYDFFVMLLSDFPHARVPFLFTAFLIAMTLRNFPKQGSLDPVSSPVAVGNEVTSQPTDESPAKDLPVETGTSKTDASGV
jgi:hypothetical protein